MASCQWTSFISTRTQNIFRNFFSWLGEKIYVHYCWFIASGLLLTLICGAIGGSYFLLVCPDTNCIENRSYHLWIPRNAKVWDEYSTIIDQFGSYPSILALLLTTTKNGDSILTPSNMDTAYDILHHVNDITLDYDADKYQFDYDSLCLRSYPTAPFCTSAYENFFGFIFGANAMLWDNESTIEQFVNVPTAPIEFFLGGFEYGDLDKDYIVGAKALRLAYALEGSTNETVREIVYGFMGKWLDYWHEHVDDYADDIQIVYYADRSFDDEISRVVIGDLPIFVAALFTMGIYLMFTLGKLTCVAARPWLALTCIATMICALIVGFSISLVIGTTFNTVVMVVPFVLLGVGVDDMIILVDAYSKTKMPDDDILNAHKRLGNALASSGLSISLTSICSSMAFFVGSATDIPGISSMMVYAAWSFVANYVLQFLLFVPLMVMDENRMRKRKNCCCPCVCIHAEVADNNESKKWNDWCNVEQLVQYTLVPLMRKRVFRIAIILFFCTTFISSIYVAQFLDTASDISKIVPDDSYVLDYLEKVQTIFTGTHVGELQIIIQNQDFSDKQVRDAIVSMMAALEAEPDALGTTTNWLGDFEAWLQINGENVDDLGSSEFYAHLTHFANDSINAVWHSEIVYDDVTNPTLIKSTRFELKVIKAGSVTSQYPQYIAWNKVMADYIDTDNGDGYAFTDTYCYAFLSYSIVRLTIENMIFAGIGIFCVLLLLLDLRMSIFIIVIVTMIDVNLFGWMWLLNVSLDTVSYTQCVMAVGLTVDYVIHITHAIADANGNTFDEKIEIAFFEMGTSVIKGAFTTFLGCLALIFSKSAAFRIFFYMFAGIITIAVSHGILLTPAILGELTFIYAGIERDAHRNDQIQMTQAIAVTQTVNNKQTNEFIE